jgi:hypothetical protein
VTQTPIRLLRIDSLVNTPPVAKTFKFQNILFQDLYLEDQIDLINTEEFKYDYDVKIEYDNLTFINVHYVGSGNLMNLQHHLSQQVIIKNSHFSNITSGIQIGSPATQSTSLLTQVLIINSSFSAFSSPLTSFISAYKGSIVEIFNCSFSDMHNLAQGAVVFAGSVEAEVKIFDSTFENNTAIEGSVFNIESKSVILCYNCTLRNNFALISGVVRVINDGYFEFYESQIYQNYAQNNPISLLFNSGNLSKLNK